MVRDRLSLFSKRRVVQMTQVGIIDSSNTRMTWESLVELWQLAGHQLSHIASCYERAIVAKQLLRSHTCL